MATTTTTPAAEPHPRAPNETLFTDPKDRFWSMYLSEAQLQDKQRTDRWKGDADGILIFTGLFAATVATFVVASYPNLSPDTGTETVAILQQVAELLANQTQMTALSSSSPSAPSTAEWSGPALSDICVNTLWFLSLVVSIIGALLATLVQQWSRQYNHDIQRRGSPSARGPIHLLLSSGIEKFRMDDALGVITSLIHVAVVLFFSGLLVFLYSLNHIVAWVEMGALTVATLFYLLLSILPIIFPDCPYQTPLTAPLRLTTMVLAILWTTMNLLLIRVATAGRGFLSHSTAVPTNPTETIQTALRTRIQPMTRRRSFIMKKAANSPGTKNIRTAIEILWQSIDDAREIADFCQTIFVSWKGLDNPDQQELAIYLFLKVDILTRVRWLVSTARPVPGKIPPGLGLHRGLGYSVSLSTTLIRCYLKSPGQPEISVLEAFMALHSDLITLVPVDLLEHCHVSTYYLIRYLLHEMMPEVKMILLRLKSGILLQRSGVPNSYLQDGTQDPCHAYHNHSDLRQIYGAPLQARDFFDVKQFTVLYELKTARAFDCALCRLVLLHMDIMDCYAEVPGLSAHWIHVLHPMLQSLTEEVNGSFRIDTPVSKSHSIYYPFAELLKKMNFQCADNAPVAAFSKNTTPGTWSILRPYAGQPSNREFYAVTVTLFNYFIQSDVAQMTYDHIAKKLGCRLMPEWVINPGSSDHTRTRKFENMIHETTLSGPPPIEVDEIDGSQEPPPTNVHPQSSDGPESIHTAGTTHTHIESQDSVDSDERSATDTVTTRSSESMSMRSVELDDAHSVNTFWARDSEGSPVLGPASLV